MPGLKLYIFMFAILESAQNYQAGHTQNKLHVGSIGMIVADVLQQVPPKYSSVYASKSPPVQLLHL